MTTKHPMPGAFINSSSGSGESGLSDVVIKVWKILKTDVTDKTVVVDDVSVLEVGDGAYVYQFIGADLSLYYYLFRMQTASADVVDKDIFGLLYSENYVSLAVSAAEAAGTSSGEIVLTTYHTLQETIPSTVTENLSAATKLWVAAKKSKAYSDTQSIFMIEKTDGLTILAEAAYGIPGAGSISVTGSSGDWEIAIKLEELQTGLLEDFMTSRDKHWIEIKALVNGDTVNVWSGQRLTITNEVVRAIS